MLRTHVPLQWMNFLGLPQVIDTCLWKLREGGAAAHIVGYKYRIVGGLTAVRQQHKEATKELKVSLQFCRKVPYPGLNQTEGAVRIFPDWLQYQLLKRITTSHRHVLEDAPRGGAAAHIVGYECRIVGGLASVRQQHKEATKGLKISLQSCRKVPYLGLNQTEGAVPIFPDWLQYQLLKKDYHKSSTRA
ncbi:hypothetical protein MRX96_053434 [Rhipicephalus microplus]